MFFLIRSRDFGDGVWVGKGMFFSLDNLSGYKRVFFFLLYYYYIYSIVNWTSSMTEEAPQIDFNFYEQPSTISYFDAILEDLKQDVSSVGADATFTAPELAYFTARFLQFQQDALCLQRQVPPRLPMQFFKVELLAKPSPLYTILRTAYIFQSDKDMSDWQFDAPEEKHIYLELVNAIRDSLKQEGYYQPPVVAFDENVEAERVQEWSHYVQMLGGKFFCFIFLGALLRNESIEDQL